MNPANFEQRVAISPSTAILPRMWQCFRGQASRTPRCPETPRLDGNVALVTGGSRGVGLETTRGLAARGAAVVSASRGELHGRHICEEIGVEFGVESRFVTLDLGDVERIPGAAGRLSQLLDGRKLDIVVANAGIWPSRHATSPQGHEIAFATNVLGHYVLIRELIERDLLADGARVVVVTGDIYVMADACTADFAYRGPVGGQSAYCRSKLGNLWYARELARRQPRLRVHAVHPGVVASELSGGDSGPVGAFKRAAFLSPEQGAQTSLFCATQPGLDSGTYYHNTLGLMQLAETDPGADAAKARRLWELLETSV